MTLTITRRRATRAVVILAVIALLVTAVLLFGGTPLPGHILTGTVGASPSVMK